MSFVPAICPQCGGKLNVDNNQQAAVCIYCGTPFIVEKAVINVTANFTTNNNFAGATINITGPSAENFYKLAANAYGSKNAKEAMSNITRALEIEPELGKAWFLKMKILELTFSIDNPSVNDVISCGKNAMNYASSNRIKTKNEVYAYFLKRANDLLTLADTKLRDVSAIKKAAMMNVSERQAISNPDAVYRQKLFEVGKSALKLKKEVPESIITSDEGVQDHIVELANTYCSMCEADVKRCKYYGAYINKKTKEERKNTLNAFKEGLPQEKQALIDDKKLNLNNHGCYIATSVYGSYDCPPVWTLRRYRDYRLAKTKSGRAFIRIYYATSPTIVKWFGNNRLFQSFFRKRLDRFVLKLNHKGFKNTPYKD